MKCEKKIQNMPMEFMKELGKSLEIHKSFDLVFSLYLYHLHIMAIKEPSHIFIYVKL